MTSDRSLKSNQHYACSKQNSALQSEYPGRWLLYICVYIYIYIYIYYSLVMNRQKRRWLKIYSEPTHSCLNNSKTLCIACRQMQTWLYRRKPRWAFMLWQWAAKLNNHSIKSNYGIHCCILLVSSLLLTGCGQVALKKVVDQWLQMDNTARVEVRRAAQLLVDDVVCQESILSFI